MKPPSNKGRKRVAKGLPKRRGGIPADVLDKPRAGEYGEPPHLPLPTQGGPRAGNPLVPGVDPLSNRSMVDAADELTDTTLRELIAGRGSILDGITYSDHLFNDALSVMLHVLAAKKILGDPSLIERARGTLERWISTQQPVPHPFLEWRQILAGTPQQIAAVALSLTEEGTRLRSSSPLGCLVTSERAAVYALFGKSVPGVQHAEVLSIASAMRAQGMADHFIVRAVNLSPEFEGILDLMRMWRDEVELVEREATVAAIEELINDCAQFEVKNPIIGQNVEEKTLGEFLDEWEREHGPFTAHDSRKPAGTYR
jgi:hypothetical protein